VKNLGKIIAVVVLAAGSVFLFAFGQLWLGVGCAVITVVVFAWAALTFQRRFLRIKSARLTLEIRDGSPGSEPAGRGLAHEGVFIPHFINNYRN